MGWLHLFATPLGMMICLYKKLMEVSWALCTCTCLTVLISLGREAADVRLDLRQLPPRPGRVLDVPTAKVAFEGVSLVTDIYLATLMFNMSGLPDHTYLVDILSLLWHG